MIIAEELGVSSANVDDSKSSNIPEVLRLLGVEGGYGEMLELSNDFAYNIIKQVGNYSESSIEISDLILHLELEEI